MEEKVYTLLSLDISTLKLKFKCMDMLKYLWGKHVSCVVRILLQ